MTNNSKKLTDGTHGSHACCKQNKSMQQRCIFPVCIVMLAAVLKKNKRKNDLTQPPLQNDASLEAVVLPFHWFS